MIAQTATVQHILKQDGQPAHFIRFPRFRVAMLVMEYFAHGYSPDEMVKHFPHLTISEVHAAMVYYYDHQAEIDDEIRAEIEAVRAMKSNGHDSPFYLRMKAAGVLT